MKLINAVIFGACCSLLAFASCKKSNNSPSVRNELIGNWKATNDAIDVNGNGLMDASEVTPDSFYTGYILVFDADGTLSYTYNGAVYGKVLWELVNNNTYIETKDTSVGGVSKYNHIDEITASALTIKDTTGGTAKWVVLVKQ